MHAGTAGSGSLPLVGWRDGRRSEAGKKNFHLKHFFFTGFSQACRSFERVTWFCTCRCVLASLRRVGKFTLYLMHVHIVSLLVCVCVWVHCISACVPAHTYVHKWACGKSLSEQMLETACSCPSSSRMPEDLAAAGIKVMIHLKRKSCHLPSPLRPLP